MDGRRDPGTQECRGQSAVRLSAIHKIVTENTNYQPRNAAIGEQKRSGVTILYFAGSENATSQKGFTAARAAKKSKSKKRGKKKTTKKRAKKAPARGAKKKVTRKKSKAKKKAKTKKKIGKKKGKAKKNVARGPSAADRLKKLEARINQLSRQLSELSRKAGTPGPRGPEGPRGPAGPPGPAGSSSSGTMGDSIGLPGGSDTPRY